jgi:hypothetical protein
MRGTQLLLICAVAAAAYAYGPTIQARIAPCERIFGMALDPNEVSPNVEDRRGQHGGFGRGRWGDLSADAGGGDIDRMPMPRGGCGPGGGAPWGDPGGGPGGGGGRLACWDNVEHRDVDMSFCERERGGRGR